MGVRGRRVALVEEISKTIISFQKSRNKKQRSSANNYGEHNPSYSIC